MIIAEVFLIGKFSDKPAICEVPLFLQDTALKGRAVIVKMNEQEKLGYIINTSHQSNVRLEGQVVEALSADMSGLTPTLVDLMLWVANYYIVYPSIALQAALPSLAKVAPKETVSLSPFQLMHHDETQVVKTELRRKIMALLVKEKKLTIKQLEKLIRSKQVRETLQELEKAGFITIEKVMYESHIKSQKAYSLAISKEEATKQYEKLKSDTQKKILEALVQNLTQNLTQHNNNEFLFKEDIKEVTHASLRVLIKKGIIVEKEIEVTRRFRSVYASTPYTLDALSSAQQDAIDAINQTLVAGEFQTYLLYGVTGSGKTAVYIEVVKKAIELGKTAIVLVPEISLTHQTAARFEDIFGEKVRVIHSHQSDGERYDAWRSLKNGDAKIALGARSSIFAPLSNVGAIVVDEEHDISYKQESMPMYHARDCAVMRAKIEGAVCVLGSATPSFESYHNAKTNKYKLLSLPERATGSTPPDINLISLIEDEKVAKSMSKTLYHEIAKRLAKSEQVILLQNRRGFAGYLLCEACGLTPHCRYCKVPMTLHAKENALKCHYCGYKQAWKGKCPSCHDTAIKMGSVGTEQIQHLLTRLFPENKIVRMDRDSTVRKNSQAEILNDFGKEKASILLGTQMVAKGLDFPNVTLVAAIEADTGLSVPDFRANEKVFSLLFQVAGRAGRSQKKGEVFLQTYQLKNPIFTYLAHQDYDGFFNFENEMRRALNFPPHARLLKIEFAASSENDAILSSEETSLFLRMLLKEDSDFEVTESAPVVITFLKGKYRYNVFIKQKNQKLFSKIMWRSTERALSQMWRQHGVKVSLDVDTYSVI